MCARPDYTVHRTGSIWIPVQENQKTVQGGLYLVRSAPARGRGVEQGSEETRKRYKYVEAFSDPEFLEMLKKLPRINTKVNPSRIKLNVKSSRVSISTLMDWKFWGNF